MELEKICFQRSFEFLKNICKKNVKGASKAETRKTTGFKSLGLNYWEINQAT